MESWKTTYRGIVSQSYLDALSYEGDIARGFGRWLKEPRDGWTHLVAFRGTGEIVGFAIAGPNRKADPEYAGELGAIYLLENVQGRGVGTRLMRGVARHLVSIDLGSMLVWVVERNPYRRLYEKLGGTPVRRSVEPVAGEMHPLIAYGWKDLRGLASP
ncbi:MAG TPA: GNAT family N-acetyltransferase [Thermoplasmata archaeon]|nr:GNAT family N-acetyltransferase [Thermoplasmata archaeon]